MKKRALAAAVCVPVIAVFVLVFNMLMPYDEVAIRRYQHDINGGVNVCCGSSTIPKDGYVSKDFTSHLPLVVIDMKGQMLPDIYQFTEDGAGREYSATGIADPDPWIEVEFSIIDNGQKENSLSDPASFQNNSLMKLRGMTSRTFEKQQYGIKLMEGGEELEESLLGMDPDEDWVLSNSILDASYIRNYVTMNIGGQVFPYTPEVRFCEVIFREDGKYAYQGLYLLEEKVKKGQGHIEIEDYSARYPASSYVVCRDRYDLTTYTLSTWASDQQLCYGYFTMVYPNAEELSAEELKRIEQDISSIEQILYSDDAEIFQTYDRYLDVDSFVDYFIINEYFMNYDAGNNSTYYYKNQDGRLAIGPLWDYDNCADNYIYQKAEISYAPFVNHPWYDRLFQDAAFQKKVTERYKELRQGILRDTYIENVITDTVLYLGNAAEREYSRWHQIYEDNYTLQIIEDAEGFEIDRNYGTYTGEALRFADTVSLHAAWMDQKMGKQLDEMVWEDVNQVRSVSSTWIAAVLVVFFLCIVIVTNRTARGQYR